MDTGYIFRDYRALNSHALVLHFERSKKHEDISSSSEPIHSVTVMCGKEPPSSVTEFFVQTSYHSCLISTLLAYHTSNDICLIGDKGVGKSALIRAFARCLGYTIELVPLYKDMSARDLLQRRGTNEKGDTVWESSPLVKGALEGSLVVLDQVEVLSFGTLASLQRL